MTSLEKENIIQMRKMGFSYQYVAKKTGVPLASVKTFCRRNQLLNKDIVRYKPTCLCCGAILKGIETNRHKKFCSKVCRYRWWNKNRAVLRNSLTRLKCEYCGNLFLHTIKNKNSVAVPVISTSAQERRGMNSELYKREVSYWTLRALTKQLIASRRISHEQFQMIDRLLLDVCRPLISELLPMEM